VLIAGEPNNPQWTKDLAIFDAEITQLERQTRGGN
jgi:hypothetical protein